MECLQKVSTNSGAVALDPPTRRGPTRGAAGQRNPWAVPNTPSNLQIRPQPPPAASSHRRRCGPACAPAALGGAARRRRRATAVARLARRPPGHPRPSSSAQCPAPPSPAGSPQARARGLAALRARGGRAAEGALGGGTSAAADPRHRPRRGLWLSVPSRPAWARTRRWPRARPARRRKPVSLLPATRVRRRTTRDVAVSMSGKRAARDARRQLHMFEG